MIRFTWDHLQLCSDDPEATAAWFATCLNADIVRRPGRVDLRLGDINLFITPVVPVSDPVREQRVPGIDHFGVTVPDLDEAFAHLTRCGAEIVQPIMPVRAGVRCCFVRAPGRILVEVLERRPAEMAFT
ncbi:MAG: glyoxalase [Roseateles depolymerans]|uniref:Glyoxalase n=1 Tax=Roseateles depolymerans TaxID=76731 RepID=A0A2W5FVS2_9BURK|nr:MAG: glyoxalase [Roseateles depolymerans]